MRQYVRIFGKIAPSLAAALVLTVTFQAQTTATAWASGLLVLAQSAEPKKEPAPCTTPAKPEQEPSKSMAPPPSPRMEEGAMKTRGAPKPMPEASGTKKMGGQTIRDKEAPEGE